WKVPSGRQTITVGAHNQPLHFVSDAGAGLIRPFQLNRIIPDLFGLPGADVADLTLNVVVPALSRDRVRYRFAQLVGTRRGHCIQHAQAPRAAAATRIRHDRVEYLAIDVIVVAAESLAGARASLDNYYSRRQIEEI